MKLPAYTFEEFATITRKFGEGHFPLLIVVGSPGLSKTRTMQAVCPQARVIQGGNLSAFGFFHQLYEYKDQTIIVDDIDGLYTQKDSVRLLKSVCQTEPVKTIGWHTKSKKLPQDAEGNPINEFQTTSRICIIANEWKNLNRNVQAVGDRGFLLTFEPSAEEVHKQVAKWFQDKEILAFFKTHLERIAEPSMRDYIHAQSLKSAGMEWKDALIQHWNKPIEEISAMKKVQAVKGLTGEERVLRFVRMTGTSRATYFRLKKEMEEKGLLP